MKKTLLLAAIALGGTAASAQVVEQPGFFDNISFGIDGGVTTPMNNGPFFKNMRPLVGVNIAKQITPTFAVGAEGQFGINTSSWAGNIPSKTAFDNSYVGAYADVDLFNLFGGYNCSKRPFTISAVAGAGWGHDYFAHSSEFGYPEDYNYFATKAGLSFNFNVSDNFTISIKPSVIYNMTSNDVAQTTAAYDANSATINVQAGLKYTFGDAGFKCVVPYNAGEVDALNGQINALRQQLSSAEQNADAWQAKAEATAAQLAAEKNKKPETKVEVVKDVTTQLNSVRYVFFRIGKYNITPDQMPNVEMIANYMKKFPNSNVVIKGYASPDGPLEVNIRLANERAQAVKNALVNKYNISANRITAEGQGIGNMFAEESWNRVAICILQETK